MTNIEKGLNLLYIVGFMGAVSFNLDFAILGVPLILSPSMLLELNPWHRALPIIFLYVSVLSLFFVNKTGLRTKVSIWLFHGVGWGCVYGYLYFDSASNEFAALAFVYSSHLLLVIVCFANAWLAYNKFQNSGAKGAAT